MRHFDSISPDFSQWNRRRGQFGLRTDDGGAVKLSRLDTGGADVALREAIERQPATPRF